MVIKVKKKAEELKLRSPDLITRHMGRALYGSVMSLVEAMGDDETLVLDFEGVKVIDSSFVDEFIVRLILDSVRSERPFYVKLKNISEISEMNIDMVLRFHSKYKNKKIVVITENICQNNAFFIGPLSDREREFIEFIRVNRSVMTGDVARFTGGQRQDVEKMMDQCHSMRIVKKDGKGVYSAV